NPTLSLRAFYYNTLFLSVKKKLGRTPLFFFRRSRGAGASLPRRTVADYTPFFSPVKQKMKPPRNISVSLP
ncbi:MAG: hypothetical protein AB7W37_01255, partial [Syntrophobacteraceae bacterium]